LFEANRDGHTIAMEGNGKARASALPVEMRGGKVGRMVKRTRRNLDGKRIGFSGGDDVKLSHKWPSNAEVVSSGAEALLFLASPWGLKAPTS